MAIKYLKKSPKTSSTDDSKTAEITWDTIKDVKDLSGFSEWRQGDTYKQVAYDVKQLDIRNKEEKELKTELGK